MSEAYSSYDEVSKRLNQIVDEVNAEGVTLDEALALYEEAVKLGLRACDLSEEEAIALTEADEGPKEPADAGEVAGDSYNAVNAGAQPDAGLDVPADASARPADAAAVESEDARAMAPSGLED